MSIEDGEVDQHVFDLVIHSMLAVLGPTVHQSSDRQNNFVELRNQEMSGGNGNIVVLLTTVIELRQKDCLPSVSANIDKPTSSVRGRCGGIFVALMGRRSIFQHQKPQRVRIRQKLFRIVRS